MSDKNVTIIRIYLKKNDDPRSIAKKRFYAKNLANDYPDDEVAFLEIDADKEDLPEIEIVRNGKSCNQIFDLNIRKNAC